MGIQPWLILTFWAHKIFDLKSGQNTSQGY